MKLYVYFPFCVKCLFVVLVDTKIYRPNPIPQHLSHLTFMRDMGDKITYESTSRVENLKTSRRRPEVHE